MLDKNNERQLAYLTRVDNIEKHPNADRLDIATISGWKVICGKGELEPGDIVVYFEIDSKLPETKPFTDMEFLVSKHFKVKTQKIRGEYSQGMIVPISAFRRTEFEDIILEAEAGWIRGNEDARFLTKDLKVTYSVAEDNKRKAASIDKYKKMAQRHGKLFAKQPFRWLMKRTWGKKLLFVFFGKKRDSRVWPIWVARTDEERVQNIPWILENKDPWIATEKIDGTSTTFTMKRGRFGKNEFYVCSRNVCFNKPDKKCYYDINVYVEMAEKYNVEAALTDILKSNPDLDWVTLQGETYGEGIQKRDYSLKEHNFMGFNLIFSSTGRLNSKISEEIMLKYGIPWVPIINENFILPDTVEELLEIATGESIVDGGMREGLVFRSMDGTKSFKAVSNEFLMTFHS